MPNHSRKPAIISSNGGGGISTGLKPVVRMKLAILDAEYELVPNVTRLDIRHVDMKVGNIGIVRSIGPMLGFGIEMDDDPGHIHTIAYSDGAVRDSSGDVVRIVIAADT